MKLPLLLTFLFVLNFTEAQISFTAPDTVCVGEKIEITYLGNEAESFCLVPDAGFLFYEIENEYLSAFPKNTIPLFSDVVQDGDNYYVFTTISVDGDLVRLDFGNSLSNNPTATIFTLDSLPSGQEGIQILNDNGHWWGFIIGGNIDFFGPEYFVRLDFGNNITNMPTVENLGNIGNLYFPHDLFITKENEEWVGITINKLGSSITRFSFGNSLGNIPTAENLGNVGNLFRSTGFSPIKINGDWHFLITNAINSTLTRIDFGNSLFNFPTGVNLGNPNNLLNRPRDITVTQVCDNFFGIVLNRFGSEILLLDFSDDIQNIPTITSFGNFGDFAFPHAITEYQFTEEGIVTFITNVDSTLSRVTFPYPLGFNIDCKESVDDFEISYPVAGIYPLQFIIDEGLPTQTSFCKDIVILPAPNLDLGKDTSLCMGTPLTLESNFPSTIWEEQTESQTFEVEESGIYSGKATIGDCTATDSLEVVFEDCASCFIFPNAFTPNDDLVNDEFKPVVACDSEIKAYQMEVFNRWGQKVFQTNNPTEGWDGKFNGKNSTSDVYVWKMIYIYAKGNEILEKLEMGDVTLIQ